MTRGRGDDTGPETDPANAVRGIAPRKPVVPVALPITPEKALDLMEPGVDPATRAWSERNGCRGDGPTLADCKKSGFNHPRVVKK